MDKDLKTSKLRVRAFRERVGNDYKRVEGYITSGEKAEVEALKRELGLSTDTAVAGLIRLGLSAYALSNSAALNETPGLSAAPLYAGCALDLPDLNVASPSGFATNSVSPTGASGAASQPAGDSNPIRQFFQSRKERQQ